MFTLLSEMCLPLNLLMMSAHYLSDVKEKKRKNIAIANNKIIFLIINVISLLIIFKSYSIKFLVFSYKSHL